MSINKNKILYYIEIISSIFALPSAAIVLVITWVIALKNHDKKSETIATFIVFAITAFSFLLMSLTDLNWLKYVISVLAALICNILAVRIQKKIVCTEKSTSFGIGNSGFIDKKIIFVAAILVGCISVGIFFIKYKPETNHIKDTNGASDYTVQTISDDMILSGGTGGMSYMSGFAGEGNTSGIRDRRYDDWDYDTVRSNAKLFSGITFFQITNAKTDSLKLTFNSTVSSGNFKAVVIVDDAIYGEFKINTEDVLTVDGVKDKIVWVKIVGESAQYSAEIQREFI